MVVESQAHTHAIHTCVVTPKTGREKESKKERDGTTSVSLSLLLLLHPKPMLIATVQIYFYRNIYIESRLEIGELASAVSTAPCTTTPSLSKSNIE